MALMDLLEILGIMGPSERCGPYENESTMVMSDDQALLKIYTETVELH